MNSIAARANFERAVQIFYNAFNRTPTGQIIDPLFDPITAFKITQSTIRVEQLLLNNSTQYNFAILNNINNGNNQQFNTEFRLNMQDTFVPTEIFVGVGLPSGTTDTTWKPLTYENPAIFSAAASDSLLTLWNGGTMQITVNKDVKVTNWDLWRHYFAPQTQQTGALGLGSPTNQVCGADDGWYPMEPYVLMIGSQGIQIQISLPNALATVDANSRLVLMMRGALAQNSTVTS
jgi:hypothetical protein